METKKRSLLVALCVIAVLVIAASAAVRLLLTRDRLLAILLPRVEKAVNATVTIGDIGVRFPFGFGVDIDELAFEKLLPDTSSFAFSSEKVTVRASLISLIKRKPEITAADVQGGAVTISNPKTRRELKLLGLDAHVSMRPAGEGFALSAKALVDSVLISALGRPPALALERIGFDGEMESDREFTRLTVKQSRVSWEDLVTVKVKGEVVNIKTAPRIALTIESIEKPLAPIMERVKSFKLGELAPAKKEAVTAAAPKVPVELSGGMMSINAVVEGLVQEPLGINISFEFNLKDLGVKAGELASIGTVNAAFKGQGAALAWQRLFPGGAKPLTPSEIQVAWRAVKLDGTVEVSDGNFVLQSAGVQGSGATGAAAPESASPAPPIRVSSLKASAAISGPDVKNVSGEFLIGPSPFTFNASMLNMMPAASELALVAKSLQEAAGRQPVPNTGLLLDRMTNVPVVQLEVKGRSFDARQYEKPLWGAKDADQAGEQAKSPKAPVPAGEGGAGGAGAILFLKNTSFTAKLDSIVTREAVVTGLEAKGTVRDGRVRVDPATFTYAGGKGVAIVSSDLRTQSRIETKVEFSAENLEAGRALGALHPLGSLVQGRFSVKSNATLVSGPNINPLMFLTAAGSALSSKGTVNIENFIEPLTSIQGFDMTPFKKFDFNEWTGSFFVKDGRFFSDDWKINSSSGAWAIKGSFGFDGSLDYAVRLVIPPGVQAQMKGIEGYKSALDLMRDTSGNLVLDIHIGGSTKHPSTSLDLTRAKSKVQDKLIEGLKKKLLR